MRPVFGFSDGMFSIDIEKRAESESTSMRWVLRVTVGSAQISTRVRSGPIPASDSATPTLRLAGNPFAASRADRAHQLAGRAFDDDIGNLGELLDRQHFRRRLQPFEPCTMFCRVLRRDR